MMDQAEGGEPQGGGDLAQMIAAIEQALQTLAQMDGPGAQNFQAALKAFEAGLADMQGGGANQPPVSPQAGGNPNARPMNG